MTYKEYRKALKAIEKKYDGEMKKLEADIDDVRRLKERQRSLTLKPNPERRPRKPTMLERLKLSVTAAARRVMNMF